MPSRPPTLLASLSPTVNPNASIGQRAACHLMASPGHGGLYGAESDFSLDRDTSRRGAVSCVGHRESRGVLPQSSKGSGLHSPLRSCHEQAVLFVLRCGMVLASRAPHSTNLSDRMAPLGSLWEHGRKCRTRRMLLAVPTRFSPGACTSCAFPPLDPSTLRLRRPQPEGQWQQRTPSSDGRRGCRHGCRLAR